MLLKEELKLILYGVFHGFPCYITRDLRMPMITIIKLLYITICVLNVLDNSL